ncbi:MAG TPA: tetratricopeptide repeat protein [Verrucomicrobiae bacterium]|nr:tetratricopeptide repeat protein [Verrucomicrobiae bacterium]
MKRLSFAGILIAAFLFSLSFAHAQDDQYFRIYSLIQEGDSFETAQPARALGKYLQAETMLRDFQKVYPEWNSNVVQYRLDYLALKTAEIKTRFPGITPPAAGGSQTNQPAATESPSAETDLQSRLNAIQIQVRELQNDKKLLEAKLKEALAAQPAAADPAELARARDEIRSLQKENDLLKVNLAEQQKKTGTETAPAALEKLKQQLATANADLAAQAEKSKSLAAQNSELQARLKNLSSGDAARAENDVLKKRIAELQIASQGKSKDATRELTDARAQIAALQSEKETLRLEKIALQNRVKTLSAANSSAAIAENKPARDENSTQTEKLNEQVKSLRAQLAVLEMQSVPYTPEELALFKKPDAKIADAEAEKKTVSQMPPGATQLVAEARRDFAARRFDQAEQKYIELLQKDENSAFTLANLAAIQLEQNHLDDAEKNITKAVAVAPNDPYALSILGYLKFRQEKYDDALDALSRAAKLDPQNPEIQNYLGLTLAEKGMRKAAETAFRKALVANPDYPDANRNLAVFYMSQNPPETALARWHYEKSVSAGMPRNPEIEKTLNQEKSK